MKHQDNLIEITFEIELLAVLEVQNKLEKKLYLKKSSFKFTTCFMSNPRMGPWIFLSLKCSTSHLASSSAQRLIIEIGHYEVLLPHLLKLN